MSLLDRLDSIARPVAPAERLGVVRVLVGLFATVYLSIRLPMLLKAAHEEPGKFAPVGLAHVLTGPAPGWVVYVVTLATLALAVPFMLGWRFRFTGPAFAVGLLWVLGYRNSFGMIFHTENLLVLHTILLAMGDSAAAVSMDARRSPSVAPARRFGLILQTMGVVTAMAYVLAGIAKLKVSGADWATGDILRNHIAHDNLRKLLLGDSYSVLGVWAARHAWLFPPLAGLTIVVELAAPLALLRGRIGRLWSLAAWSFHAGVLALMWILFPYQLFFIAFTPFFDTEKLYERVQAFRAKRRSVNVASPTDGVEHATK